MYYISACCVLISAYKGIKIIQFVYDQLKEGNCFSSYIINGAFGKSNMSLLLIKGSLGKLRVFQLILKTDMIIGSLNSVCRSSYYKLLNVEII